MFSLFTKKKQEVPLVHKKSVEELHKKYPKKHIDISMKYAYYDHADGYYKTEYSVYVEDKESHQYFPTLLEVKKYVQYLCEKGV